MNKNILICTMLLCGTFAGVFAAASAPQTPRSVQVINIFNKDCSPAIIGANFAHLQGVRVDLMAPAMRNGLDVLIWGLCQDEGGFGANLFKIIRGRFLGFDEDPTAFITDPKQAVQLAAILEGVQKFIEPLSVYAQRQAPCPADVLVDRYNKAHSIQISLAPDSGRRRMARYDGAIVPDEPWNTLLNGVRAELQKQIDFLTKLIALQRSGIAPDRILARLQSDEAVPTPDFIRSVETQNYLGV